MRFNGIGVNAVVELGKGAIQVPGKRQAIIFIILESLEFLDKIELELDRYPGCEFKCNILVGICAAVSSRFGNKSDCACFLDPLLRCKREAV